MLRYALAITWALVLVLLFVMHPSDTDSLCPLHLLGLGDCWGCGIGRAIHYAMHLNFTASFHSHWLGIPAVLALGWQIAKPFFTKTSPYEPTTTVNDAGTASE